MAKNFLAKIATDKDMIARFNVQQCLEPIE